MIFDHILNAIRFKFGLQSDEELAEYLTTLQTAVKSLRLSYKSNPVKVDYAKPEIQIAYLIVYFPYYARLLSYVLKKHDSHFGRYMFIQHHFVMFGGGPCPELISYLHFATSSGFSIKEKVKVTSVDIAAGTWAFTRDLNLNQIAPHYGLNNLVSDFDVHQIDIATPSSQVVATNFPSLVVFQNCLNESDSQKHIDIVVQFLQIFNAMQTGSTLLIIDIGGYDKVLKLIEKIESSLVSNYNALILRSVSNSYEHRDFSSANLPKLISDNLLNGKDGLIPKKYIKFIYSLIFKP